MIDRQSFPVLNLQLAAYKSTAEFTVMSFTADDGSLSPPADGSHSPPSNGSHSPIADDHRSPIAEDYHSPLADGSHSTPTDGSQSSPADDSHAPIADGSHSPVTDDLHSPIADDYHSPPADVHRSTKPLNIDDDDENEEEYGDQNNENILENQLRQNNSDSLRNPVTMPEIDDLGFKNNNKDVNSGDTDLITARDKPKPDLVPISPNRSVIEDDEHELIYNFPRGISTLNVNGRPKFELVTVRENGRLQMFMVPNLSPQLVRSPVRDGRLKMWLLNDGHHGGEQPLPPVRRSI